MTSILDIKNLSVVREDVKILHRMNWQVTEGQHWVILGSNGSGKTCLLNTLTGYLTPTDGEVTVLGRTYGEYDWRELRKEIGLVSSGIRQMIADEELGLDIVACGKEAMLNHWENWKSRELKQAKQILKLVECTYLAERPWMVLSQGERQRILIGRALMTNSRILILDEPCAGLDPVARENFLHFLNRLAKSKKNLTFILVTHHVEEISPIFTHCLLLKNGKVLKNGKIRECLTSSALKKAFDANIHLGKKGNRYSLSVLPNKKVVA